jgi:DNA-binding PadR family transcriptional regulator
MYGIGAMAGQIEGQAALRDAGAGDWRAIRSPVSWALLGLVIERPGYGYELVKRFEREYAQMLQIKSDWHIYRALDGLKRKSLVEEIPADVREQPAAGRQPKPHYRATDEGVRLYAHWLTTQVAAPRRQSRLFVRQLAVLSSTPQRALEILDRYEEACLDVPDEARSGARSGAHSDGDGSLAARLAAEESRLSLEATLPWLEFARSELQALAARRSERDAARRFERDAST